VSLESTNQRLPTCPNCHVPLGDPDTMFCTSEFDDTVAHETCDRCGELIKITIKRLYDTEVVR